eukprot:372280-Rhodomonas_salina.3
MWCCQVIYDASLGYDAVPPYSTYQKRMPGIDLRACEATTGTDRVILACCCDVWRIYCVLLPARACLDALN